MNSLKTIYMLALVFCVFTIASCAKSFKTEKVNSEIDLKDHLYQFMDSHAYDKALELLRTSKNYDFVYEGQSLLSYCISNNLTEMAMEIISNLSSDEVNEICTFLI